MILDLRSFSRVAVDKVNILTVELDEPLDQAGFGHVATAVGARLGAHRIGAGVYGAEAGVPIWPFWLIRNGPGQDGILLSP